MLIFFLFLLLINLTNQKSYLEYHTYRFDDLNGLQEINTRMSVVIENKKRELQILKQSNFRNGEMLQGLIIKNALSGMETNALSSVVNAYDIALHKNHLPEIKTDTFKDMQVITLNLGDNQIQTVHQNAFKNLSRLSFLYLYSNNLTLVKNGVFNNLTLVYLDLSSNKLCYIEEGAFEDMQLLLQLILKNNQLTHFEAAKLFTIPTSLTDLHLDYNLLTKIDRKTLRGLSNLQSISVSSNQIKAIENNSFSDVRELKWFKVAGNVLVEDNFYELPSSFLEQLKYLDVSNNQMTWISTKWLNLLSNVRDIQLLGNPWQCGCLDIILEWMKHKNYSTYLNEYFRGTQPVCVVPEDAPKECQRKRYLNLINKFNIKYKKIDLNTLG